jgi:hypothetical protein
MGAQSYRNLLARLLAEGPADLPAVAQDGPAAMGGEEPYAYYGTERGASPHWVNRVTRESLYQLMTLDTMSAAELLGPTPLLVVHGRTDAYCSPEAAQAVYERASEPKEILWLDTTNHIDLYDVEEYVAPAVQRLAEFFTRRLAPQPAYAPAPA